MRILTLLLFLFTLLISQVALGQKSELTIPMIMQKPVNYIGSTPSNIFWGEDGKTIYFNWNPEGAESDSLYAVSVKGGTPVKVSASKRRNLPSAGGDYNRSFSHKVYEKRGDLFIVTVKSGKIRQLTKTLERERSPVFQNGDKNVVVYRKGSNLYRWNGLTGITEQLTDFRSGSKAAEPGDGDGNDAWLKRQERSLISVLKEREQRSNKAKENRERAKRFQPTPIYLSGSEVEDVNLSPDGRYVTFRTIKENGSAKRTEVPDYVRISGYTENLPARPKVGSPQDTYRFGVYDIKSDTIYYTNPADIPGIDDPPHWIEVSDSSEKKQRSVITYGPYWSDNGKRAVVIVRAWDNKDRWIMRFDPVSAKMEELHREHNDAWVGGPGISGWVFVDGNIGWLPDNRTIWFQSEESGYSHLYTLDVLSGKQKALTSGEFEVTGVQMSRDKKRWYLTTSEVHPGERHFYSMPLSGGKRTQITNTSGSHQITLSPDEKTLAVRYSYTTKPWQLYIMKNKAGAVAKQVTDNVSEAFKAYDWRVPEIISFKAKDGADVAARIYRPANPVPNGPAVIFVHGAGYLQNVHRWWGPYYREYMFHNLLVDHGYTVLDIDYRGSAGYGRDWRTGIYRHMGGKDLEDHVDGAAHLVKEYKVDPERIGIYGGSYGGFITFMAMFTRPGVFACGAALRPVSDWAHYNHPYTRNILNEPQTDSLAYVRSSPIYHAEGLQDPLLICHGMIDTNVHFQDVVRLTQRLIELGKEDWEVALYPLEGHGFTEPSSWTDEYKRIFKLFEENLK